MPKRHDSVHELFSWGNGWRRYRRRWHWSEKAGEACWLNELGKEGWRRVLGFMSQLWEEQLEWIEESRRRSAESGRKSEQRQGGGGALNERRVWYDAWEH